MKKEYTTPVIEKIAFNYRDQVVAASGNPSGGGNTGIPETPSNPTNPTSPTWGQIIGGFIGVLTDRSPYVNWC